MLGLAACFGGALAGAAPAARADVIVDVDNGNTFEGDIPSGEDIRIRFPMVKGGMPKISMRLTGAIKFRPISFQRTVLYGPDGKVVDVPVSHYRQTHRTGIDDFGFSGFAVPTTGVYTLVISTNSTVATTAKGKFTAKRPKSQSFTGDENSRVISVELQRYDQSQLTVSRVSGSPPLIESYKSPTLVNFRPQQRANAKGSAMVHPLGALETGEYRYTIGYTSGLPATGRFKGKIRIIPSRTTGRAFFDFVNAPGVPLTVRSLDRFLTVSWSTGPVGLSTDGTTVTVTGEAGGKILAQRYDLDLAAIPGESTPVEIATSADLPPGGAIQGHRTAHNLTHHFVAFSSADGTSIGLVKVRPDLVRDSFIGVVNGATTTTQELFVACDDYTVSVGRSIAGGHRVHLIDAASMIEFNSVAIGGGIFSHSRGAGAAWRKDPGLFEFFAPDTIVYGQASNLHHYVFDANWTLYSTADDTPVADPDIAETFSTAIVVDDVSGVTVVHYLTPENPLTGAGRVQRVLFDDTGNELPGSRATLQGTDRHRPSAIIVSSSLFVASEGSASPYVERYRLLRQ